uniref:Uncharacterized protein n=1 Tax=Opuntia streptacantha TaxID=393608 RepID=A0A7C9EFA1_OPUST
MRGVFSWLKHPLLMANSQHKQENRAEKRKGTNETKAAGEEAGHHHGLWYPPWAGRGGFGQTVPSFYERCVLVQAFGPCVLPWIFRFGPIAPRLQPLLTWFGLNIYTFS